MKQRLVGALVLICGGVVLWSLLFTGPASYRVDQTSQIPEPPAVESVPDMTPRTSASVEPVDTPLVPEPETPVEPHPEPDSRDPRLDPETDLPEAWVVQVASFSSRDNAEELVEQLQGADYKAYIRESRVADDDVYRVVVGPYVQQGGAARAKRTIEERFEMQALLMRFER